MQGVDRRQFLSLVGAISGSAVGARLGAQRAPWALQPEPSHYAVYGDRLSALPAAPSSVVGVSSPNVLNGVDLTQPIPGQPNGGSGNSGGGTGSLAPELLAGPATIPDDMVPHAAPISSTLFHWYRRFEHAASDAIHPMWDAMSFWPDGGPFDSSDFRRLRRQLNRMRASGISIIDHMAYGFPGEGLPTDRDMLLLEASMPIVARAGMSSQIYWDSAIRFHFANHLCNIHANDCPETFTKVRNFNFDDHNLRPQVESDFALMLRHYILPNINRRRPERSHYNLLKAADGRVIRDPDNGGVRPIIAIYVVRAWTDNSGYATINNLNSNLTALARAAGLGRPALVLDVIRSDGSFDVDLVRAFGDRRAGTAPIEGRGENVVALTAFGPVDKKTADRNGLTSLGDWVPRFERTFRVAAGQLSRAVGSGLLHDGIQIWPSAIPHFDKLRWAEVNRRPDLAFSAPALSPEDHYAMFSMAADHVLRFASSTHQPQPQLGQIKGYFDELFESTALCQGLGPGGQEVWPNFTGCASLETLRQVAIERGIR